MAPAVLESSSELISGSEFLRIATMVPEKLELVEGVIRAMPGGSNRHNTALENILVETRNLTRGKGPCRVLGSEYRLDVPVKSTCLHPDAMIACPPR